MKSRQMVIRGHRGDDIQNVNRTNQSDLVGHKTDPRTFVDCTRGMCVAAATPGNFSAVEWTFDMLFCSWILVRELRFGDEQHCHVSFPAGFAYDTPPHHPVAGGCAWYILLNMDRRIIVAAISRDQMHRSELPRE